MLVPPPSGVFRRPGKRIHTTCERCLSVDLNVLSIRFELKGQELSNVAGFNFERRERGDE